MGGEAPNAIPERTEGPWYVRAETLAELAEVGERVWRCFEAGALATGCQLTVTLGSEPYAGFHADQAALAAYQRHGERLGRTLRVPRSIPTSVPARCQP